ncbi:ATPase, T2SS/T4P/T4SS family [Paenibacillus sp. UMB4589-SE434]|uniref:ATPase, T2SS/T4P/T4SS family n=1 Tax=Paenibacillus sp. UMB4589-SE434 TaxID=3046314 RepID=UPI00254E4D71|nr:ATPase, T2SS/T4P/T4SS family [Paenibacillus sp. UMB4589-SE434]MDK8180379.1 ATPase, T2SS/T4P/T4SS family [Paenibacillus sp. UMB4589-SE434]
MGWCKAVGIILGPYGVLLIVTTTLLITILIIWLIRRKWMWKHEAYHPPTTMWNWEELAQFVRETFQQWTSDPLLDHYDSDETYRRVYTRRESLRRALRVCNSGDRTQKEFVKDMISELITTHVVWSEEQYNILIPFQKSSEMCIKDKFDILLFVYIDRFGADAMHELIQKYKWDQMRRRYSSSGQWEPSYEISEEDINDAFRQERFHLQDEMRIRLISQRIYEQYKGLSVIDELRDQRVDGISGGVSGMSTSTFEQVYASGFRANEIDGKQPRSVVPLSYDSVWLFYKGKSIRMSFLSFGNEAELRRVCHNIYKYRTPGPLTEADGYRVNDLKDGSRIVVMRPPFSESWAFFLRKFDRTNPSLEKLIPDKGSQDVIQLLRYLMKGACVTAITGAQGSGKTTLLMAIVEAIYPFYPLRVQEQAFELHLRQLYPERNILTLRETERISGQAGLDVQKKTDGSVHILGEVSTDPIAAWMIQMAQVASLFTVFTHHAKTFPDLIMSLRNSLLKTGMFHDERIAEQQVASIIHVNVHLGRDTSGKRYIERITECIPLSRRGHTASLLDGAAEGITGNYPINSWSPFIEVASNYYKQCLNQNLYDYRNIVEFKNDQYIWVNGLTEQLTTNMLKEMTEEDNQACQDWLSSRGKSRVS